MYNGSDRNQSFVRRYPPWGLLDAAVVAARRGLTERNGLCRPLVRRAGKFRNRSKPGVTETSNHCYINILRIGFPGHQIKLIINN